jgi:hypothetical protein
LKHGMLNLLGRGPRPSSEETTGGTLRWLIQIRALLMDEIKQRDLHPRLD